jgi:hypothetical protein
MSTPDVEHDSTTARPDAGRTGRTTLTWVAAVLAVLAAVAVVGFAYLKVLGTAACTDRMCDDMGPSEPVFGFILYGTPIIAVVALVITFVTARKPWGFVLPLIAWAVVAVSLIILIVTF